MLLAAATPGPREIPFDTTARAGLPAAAASFTAHGATHRCTGVRLADLAARAGLPAGEALRGEALRLLVVAEAKDGYRIAFTLAELDPSLGNKGVIVADRCDGAALPAAEGPLRLVVPGEARAARSLRGLTALRVVTLP
ncbi:hypothetical protein IP88_08760 [alpha proteobacterium AAP81b]|nr:hypothetical protein IP88_08760 [alpha proteobacterium AAP81b]